ncbi:actin binding protein [Marasmius crinis-equi]|uniref:Actin binding protein n=1 Tax=Marasmius crinis-equi TaxID=585013 RepID=A0ABR3F8R4_9AGAR
MGNGGLEELEEEFYDGRIQYAFVGVINPNSKLPKFVQINWCGDGVPEAKKGLFYTHSSAVASFLKGTHVVISARDEGDVQPSVIMKRVEAASGAKYSFQKEAPRKAEPIAPVGTNYKPIGQVDIGALRKQPSNTISSAPAATSKPALPAASRPVFGGVKPASSASAKPVLPVATRPVFGGSGGASAGSLYGRGGGTAASRGSAPEDAWPDEPPKPAAASQPPPPPAAARPPVQVLPTTSKALGSSASSVQCLNVPTKSTTKDELIAPAQSAYKPVSLPAPKKLRNPFSQFQQQAQQQEPVVMTWSKRHAPAKRERGEEENWCREAGIGVLQGLHTCPRYVPLDFNENDDHASLSSPL